MSWVPVLAAAMRMPTPFPTALMLCCETGQIARTRRPRRKERCGVEGEYQERVGCNRLGWRSAWARRDFVSDWIGQPYGDFEHQSVQLKSEWPK